MKRILYLLAAALLMSAAVKAQTGSEKVTGVKAASINLSSILIKQAQKNGNGVQPAPAALFDIQEVYVPDTIASTTGSYAALAWSGTEWWFSLWNKDSLFTMDAAGNLTASFTIAGVGRSNSGVRSITTDGTNLYMADNTDTIKIVNPATKTLTGTILVSSLGFNARAITYSPATNGGLGGFYVSNFATPIAEIDMNGNVLNSIPTSTHGLGSIYGIALDNLSVGGPFLWCYDQGSAGTFNNLVRLELPSGIPTFVIHDVNSDVGTQVNNGIAGGLFITNSFVTGENTIAGISQGAPFDALFAYELDSVSQIAYDALLDTVKWLPAYTQVADQQVSAFTFPAVITNFGGASLGAVTYTVEVNQGGPALYTGTGTTGTIASGSSTLVAPNGNFTPSAIGDYTVEAGCSIVGQTDGNPVNDTLSFLISVTDTVMARDNGVVTGGLGIGSNLTGILGQIYSLPNTDVLTSATFRCNGPTEGDTTRVVVYSMTAGVPGTQIGQSDYYFFTAADTDGVVLTLPILDMSGNPLSVAAGTYFVGVEEHQENVSLGTSEFNWRSNVTFITFPGQAWANNEDFGFRRIYVLRLNTGNSITSIGENPEVAGLGVFPNPAGKEINLRLSQPLKSYSVMDMKGSEVLAADLEIEQTEIRISIGQLPVGVYQIRAVDHNGAAYSTRFVKQ
jgi:hypothetical protein